MLFLLDFIGFTELEGASSLKQTSQQLHIRNEWLVLKIGLTMQTLDQMPILVQDRRWVLKRQAESHATPSPQVLSRPSALLSCAAPGTSGHRPCFPTRDYGAQLILQRGTTWGVTQTERKETGRQSPLVAESSM